MNTVSFGPVPNNVTFAKAFQYTASDGTTPVDLTGSTLTMQVRASASDPISVFPVVVTITDAVNGRFTVSVPVASLVNVPPKTFVHDLVRLRPDGIKEQVWAGTMAVTAGVTR